MVDNAYGIAHTGASLVAVVAQGTVSLEHFSRLFPTVVVLGEWPPRGEECDAGFGTGRKNITGKIQTASRRRQVVLG